MNTQLPQDRVAKPNSKVNTIYFFFPQVYLSCVIRLRWISPGIMSIDHHSSKIASDCSASQKFPSYTFTIGILFKMQRIERVKMAINQFPSHPLIHHVTTPTAKDVINSSTIHFGNYKEQPSDIFLVMQSLHPHPSSTPPSIDPPTIQSPHPHLSSSSTSTPPWLLQQPRLYQQVQHPQQLTDLNHASTLR